VECCGKGTIEIGLELELNEPTSGVDLDTAETEASNKKEILLPQLCKFD
jgi:hypothetical protein